jgi:serine/threonine protein phosphatase 1
MPDDTGLTVAIGDVHGRYDLMVALLAEIEEFACGKTYRLVMLGNMIDRGSESAKVVALLRKLQSDYPGRIICLRGPHEEMLAEARRHSLSEPRWLRHGGAATLRSFGVASAGDMPADAAEWLAGLPSFHQDRHRRFAPAAMDPLRPLLQLPAGDDLCCHGDTAGAQAATGRFLVHGHAPVPGKRGTAPRPEERPDRLNLDTGAAFGGALTAAVFDNMRPGPLGFFQALSDGSVAFDVARDFQPPTVGAMALSALRWTAVSPRGRLVASAALSGFFAVTALGAYRSTEQPPGSVVIASVNPAQAAATPTVGAAPLPQAGMFDAGRPAAGAGRPLPLQEAAANPVAQQSPTGQDDGESLAGSSYDVLPAGAETLARAVASPAVGKEATAGAVDAEPRHPALGKDAPEVALASKVSDDGAILAASSYDLLPAGRDTLGPPQALASADAQDHPAEDLARNAPRASGPVDIVASIRTKGSPEAAPAPTMASHAAPPPRVLASQPDPRRKPSVAHAARLVEDRPVDRKREARRRSVAALPSCAVVPSRIACGRLTRTATHERRGFWALLLEGHESRDRQGSAAAAASSASSPGAAGAGSSSAGNASSAGSQGFSGSPAGNGNAHGNGNAGGQGNGNGRG